MYIKHWIENESKPMIKFLYNFKDRLSSLISKDQKENIICTIADVRGDILGLPHGTTPAAVIANKKLKLRSMERLNCLMLRTVIICC